MRTIFVWHSRRKILRIITSELEGNEYAACRALTDKANEVDVENVIVDGEKETDDVVREYYRKFLDLVAEKNPKIFNVIRSEDNMSGALMEIMKDDVNKKVNAAVDASKQEQTVELCRWTIQINPCALLPDMLY